jgi:hypothetical protein
VLSGCRSVTMIIPTDRHDEEPIILERVRSSRPAHDGLANVPARKTVRVENKLESRENLSRLGACWSERAALFSPLNWNGAIGVHPQLAHRNPLFLTSSASALRATRGRLVESLP